MSDRVANEPLEALSIGLVVGGRDPRVDAWVECIEVCLRELSALAEGVPKEVALNVVFHVPGPIWQPTYSGMRTGYFNKRERAMMVQVAVPAEPVGDMRGFVVESLAGAVDLAEAWCVKRGHCSSLATARDLARRMRRLN